MASEKNGKGTGKEEGGAGVPSVRGAFRPTPYCRFFLKGQCRNDDNCAFAHLPQEAVDEFNRARAIAKEKANAEASPAKVASLRPALVIPAPRSADAEGWRAVRRRSRQSS